MPVVFIFLESFLQPKHSNLNYSSCRNIWIKIMDMARINNRMSRTRHDPDRTILALLIGFIALAAATIVFLVIVIHNFVTGGQATAPTEMPTDSALSGDAALLASMPQKALQPVDGPTPQAWDGSSRVTILFMGLDYRDWENNDIPRTDSMILLTLDPATHSAAMLSIPRDLWVNIPGYGEAKINTAYFDGEADRIPGGGAGLAVKTVSEFLKVPINFYARIDFDAFVRFIDDLGGLDMDIKEKIVVDPIGPNNTVTLKPGVQTLDGKTVLAYARNRDTAMGDMDRAKRQQEVIMAIRKQVLTLNMLPVLIAQAPKIYQDLSKGIHTNLSLAQMVQLALQAQQVPTERIKRGVITEPDQAYETISWNGQWCLVPIMDQVNALRDEIFSTSGYADQPLPPVSEATNAGTPKPSNSPAPVKELPYPVQAEQARIEIQNATLTVGLAARTGEELKKQGFNITDETTADQLSDTTAIVIYNNKPNTVEYLAQWMKVPESLIYNRTDPSANLDIVIILGNDWARRNK
jgi:LCP family protein required for cell wall assembly